MRELLSNNSLFVGQLYEDKSLALRARDLIFFTTDLQTVNYYTLITARAELFLNRTSDSPSLMELPVEPCWANAKDKHHGMHHILILA